MAKRDNHYELAFEELLRSTRQPYVAVDEARRSLVSEGSLKSLDFLVSPTSGQSLLVDIKGRRFPSGTKHPQYWRNWSTADDLRGLAEWSRHFGRSATPVLVFAYWVTGSRSPVPPAHLFWWRDNAYGFVAIRLADYLPWAKQLSVRWGTVSVPVGEFRRRAVSWQELVASHGQTSESRSHHSEDVWQSLAMGIG